MLGFRLFFSELAIVSRPHFLIKEIGGEKINKTKKYLTYALIIMAIILLTAMSLQAGFATTYNIDNTTIGGIRGTLNNATDGDIIILDEGTYAGNNNTNIVIDKNITIQGKTKDKVILDAQNLTRIFTITDSLNVTFINITFLKANSNGAGAGLHVTAPVSSAVYINIINCNFTGNTPQSNSGGGISITTGNNGFAYINVTNSSFTNNYITSTSINDMGGGLHLTTGVNGSINVNIINCSFINNIGGYSGGGIAVTTGTNGTSNVNVFNCSFIANNASTGGGGMYTSTGTNGTSNVNVFNCSFIDNKCTSRTSGTGAGLNFHIGRLEGIINGKIVDCTFRGNTAVYGGGLALTVNTVNHTRYRAIIASVVNCTFIGNNGTHGGGMSAAITGSGAYVEANVINCTFTDNSAVNGGGLRTSFDYENTSNVSSFVNLTVIGSTFKDNNAIYGGGIFAGGVLGTTVSYTGFINLKAVNCTLVGNTAIYGGGIYNNASMSVMGNTMNDNLASILGNAIYNNAWMGILNLTYLKNVTHNVTNGTEFVLYAYLVDDMGNLVTGQNISFYVDRVFIGSIESIEGYANLKYLVIGENGDLLSVYGSYDGIGYYPLIINEGKLRIVGPENGTLYNKTPNSNSDPNSDLNSDPNHKPISKPNFNSKTSVEHNNKTTENPVAKATMKNTGIPTIVILVALLNVLGFIWGKRK